MPALAEAYTADQRRIAELEQKVRQLSDIVVCIPMAAAGLGLIPLQQYRDAVTSPSEAMRVLEEISGLAELQVAYTDVFPFDHGFAERLRRLRRSRIAQENAALLHLAQQS